jgi:hypothetical protein
MSENPQFDIVLQEAKSGDKGFSAVSIRLNN